MERRSPRTATIDLRSSLIGKALVGVVTILVGLSLLGQVMKFEFGFERAFGFIPAFFLDNEGNVPAYVSSVLLGSAAVILGVIATAKHDVEDRYARHWTGLAVIFGLMSLDEMVSIHERLIGPLRAILHVDGWLHFAWVVPGSLVVLLLAVVYFRFVLHLDAPFRVWFVGAGLIYVAGALGMELVGGQLAFLHGEDNFTYMLVVTIEETLELIGISLFLVGLVRYAGRHVGHVQVRFDPADDRG